MSEYRKVWVDREGDLYTSEPNSIAAATYGPIVEHKVVPADGIVVEDALPTVNIEGGSIRAGRTLMSDVTIDGESVESRAHRYAVEAVAIDEFLRERAAHPPVDEAQVEALADDLAVHFGHKSALVDFARRLIEQGWSKPEVDRG